MDTTKRPLPVPLPEVPSAGGPALTVVRTAADLMTWLGEHTTAREWDAESTSVINPRELSQLLDVATKEPPADAARVSGSLAEIPLPDLLQHFLNCQNLGGVSVQDDEGAGHLVLGNGLVTAAYWSGAEALAGIDALRKIGSLKKGTFWFGAPTAPLPPSNLAMSPMALFVELLKADRPVVTEELDDEAMFALAVPLEPPLSALRGDELDAVQLVVNHGSFGMMRDFCPLPPAELWETLRSLCERGYLRRE